MENYEAKLEDLKVLIDKAKTQKFKAEAAMDSLKSQEKDLIEKLNEMNIKPENLKSEINKLESEIKSLFDEAYSLLPKNE